MPAGPPLSERAFHAWLARTLTGPSRGRLALGDDTAAIPAGGHRVALLTTDALVEWTHFLPGSPPEAVGAAAAGASLSDVAAKGGRPIALTLDLLLPAETPTEWARAVVRGADRQMRRYGGAVVGGDTKPSAERAVVGTLLAWGDDRRLAPHDRLRPGDVLVTTGTVGAGGAAYRRFTAANPPDAPALRGLLRIRPRLREGAALARYAHAMIDTSDGIAESARRLAEASGVRVEIDAAALPLAPGLARSSDGTLPPVAFFGGDYELLAGLPERDLAAAVRSVAAVGGRLRAIGRVRTGRGAELREAGSLRPMPPAGWQPFGRGAPAARPGGPGRAPS